MNRSSNVLLVFAICLVFANGVSAQRPLYDENSVASLFTDIKAFRVGDIITIVIRENSVASANSKTETDYKSEVSGGPGGGALGFVDIWGLNSESKYSGDGRTQRSGSLSAEMTAMLVEVLPNGHFRIEGKRTVRINGEFEMISVSGVVRARDITPDNRIMSTQIANANIAYEGKGDVSAAGSPGLFTKIVNWLF